MRRRSGLLAVAAAAPLALSLLSGVATPASAAVVTASADCMSVLVAAHRGSTAPTRTENTVRAARAAAKLGADVVEGDMQLTRDGSWVMMHDATVDRTTTGRGTVSAMTAAQVRALTTNDGVRGGVPSVNSLVTAMQAYPDVQLQLEVKPSRVSTTAVRALLRVFSAAGVKDRLLITSFSTGALATVRSADASWRTALISTSAISTTTAQRNGVAVVVEQAAVTAAYVDQMHAAGLVVYGWTVDNQRVWQDLVNEGVDGIITNRVPDAMTWCAD